MGTRHSFSAIGDTDGDVVSVMQLPQRFELDAAARTLTIDGGSRYGDICGPLHEAGFALHNLPSLAHISVGGACATGTHGSGVRNRGLASVVVALDLVAPDGSLHSVSRDGGGAIPLEAAAVSLGALGVVTALTLAVEPTYLVRQEVFTGFPMGALLEDFDAVMAAGDSVSCFTDWSADQIDQVWVKRRVDGPASVAQASTDVPGVLRGAARADRPHHPIRGFSPEACTPQLGEPGPWHDRLPHFRLSHTPSAGAELQSEYFVDRRDAALAFAAVREIADVVAPLTLVSEVRSIAADEEWLSPAYGRDSISIHFTWRQDPEPVMAALPVIEAALAPFAPRAHWAKLSTLPPGDVREGFGRLPEFVELAARLDPTAKLQNDYLARLVDWG